MPGEPLDAPDDLRKQALSQLSASCRVKYRACRIRRPLVFLIGPEPMKGEASPAGGGFAFLDPLLGRAALVVEAEDGKIRSGHGGDDEAHPRNQLFEVMVDLGDYGLVR